MGLTESTENNLEFPSSALDFYTSILEDLGEGGRNLQGQDACNQGNKTQDVTLSSSPYGMPVQKYQEDHLLSKIGQEKISESMMSRTSDDYLKMVGLNQHFTDHVDLHESRLDQEIQSTMSTLPVGLSSSVVAEAEVGRFEPQLEIKSSAEEEGTTFGTESIAAKETPENADLGE